jgi:hypothetical protein
MRQGEPRGFEPDPPNPAMPSSGSAVIEGPEMRFNPLIGIGAVLLLMQASLPAQAGLIGNGTNTVAALLYLGASTVPVVTSSTAPYTNPAPFEIEGPSGPTNPPPPPSLIPAHFPLSASDEATIDVADTTITITNEAALPFCSVSTTPCPDVFSGFGFVFFGNVDITGVTVDPASMFSPVAGGLTFGATDIFVNLVGETPSAGAALILDVTTGGTTIPTPEPASLALLTVGILGCWAAGLRGKRRPALP